MPGQCGQFKMRMGIHQAGKDGDVAIVNDLGIEGKLSDHGGVGIHGYDPAGLQQDGSVGQGRPSHRHHPRGTN
jgi:hypothetical protein